MRANARVGSISSEEALRRSERRFRLSQQAAGIASLELDVARIDRVIQRIRDQTVLDMPTRDEKQVDPATGQTTVIPVPTYMPQKGVDNLKVWRERLSDWMKTTDYETQPPDMKNVAERIMDGIDFLAQQEQAAAVAAQNAQAEQLGMNNAAKVGQPKPLPDMSAPGSKPAFTPNTPPPRDSGS